MKLIVPFDTSISPPKRFWSALWKPGVQPENPALSPPKRFWPALWTPGVQPENPAADIETLHRSMVPGAPHVLLDQEDHVRVRTAEGMGAWAQIERAFGAIGEWFARRDATEDEERAAASGGLDALEKAARLRDARRSRHLRM